MRRRRLAVYTLVLAVASVGSLTTHHFEVCGHVTKERTIWQIASASPDAVSLALDG